jgi:hypothetical protein
VPPGDLTATAVDQHEIDLQWTDNTKVEVGFEILRSDTPDGVYEGIAEVPPNTTSYHDIGLTVGTQYWYAVAVNESYYDDEIQRLGTSGSASATTLAGAAGIARGATVSVRVARPLSAMPRLTPSAMQRMRRTHAAPSRPIPPVAQHNE